MNSESETKDLIELTEPVDDLDVLGTLEEEPLRALSGRSVTPFPSFATWHDCESASVRSLATLWLAFFQQQTAIDSSLAA